MTNNEAIGILVVVVETARGRCFVTDEAISDAYAMAIKALEAQELSNNSPKLDKENGDLQPTCNQLAIDTISRQEAIDAECEVCQIAPKKERGHNCTYYVHGCKEIECLRALPSAQPEIEERKEESAQNVPKEDLISRKAAIDAINKALDRETLLNSFVRKVAVDALKTMPSAEPEIVRCKDCQHFRTYYHGTESDPVITHACVWFLDREMGLEDYCSKGVIR